MLAQIADLDPWRFQFHPEVWVLVAFLTGSYVYMVRVIGPKAVPAGQPAVSRRNIVFFVGAILMLWIASDWPMHDISEEYLYSAHMLQHMMLSYFLPPLALMATPEWLMRAIIGDGKLYRVVAFMCRPVFAALAFNTIIVVTHIPGAVNASVDNGPLHYSLHVLVVVLSLLMWMPVVGPIPEWQIGPLAKCIYLFIQSLIPTIPAAWLTFADDAVYRVYDQPIRVWGISVAHDQQLAGAIMKSGGGFFLWAIIIYLFFKRFASSFEYGHTYGRYRPIPAAELTGDEALDGETPLTTADVERELAHTQPARDGD